MKFTILRLLTNSELGMFHEYRRQGKERAKQRAINFDRDVIDTVFPSATDSDIIPLNCRRLEDESTVVQVASWIKRQSRNWRLEGDCPASAYYEFVHPGALFAMSVDASTTPATASWVVIAADHPAHAKILSHGESARLGKSAMIALYGDEGTHSRAILATSFPQVFKEDIAMSNIRVRCKAIALMRRRSHLTHSVSSTSWRVQVTAFPAQSLILWTIAFRMARMRSILRSRIRIRAVGGCVFATMVLA